MHAYKLGKMTYYYNTTRYRSVKNTRLWTDRIFLSVLLLTALTIGFYNSTTINLIIAATCMLFLTALIMLITRRHKVPFVEIADGTLSYFDTAKTQMVSVNVHDITHISTRFCQLDIHTEENTHSLNLGLIRNEKTRWEIKEMIREMARRARYEV